MRFATLLSALLLPGAGITAEVRATAFPAGILDPSGRTAYVSNAAGGIDALDLITGDTIWRTNEAQVPLLVAGDRLYAQAGVMRNRLRVLVFDLGQKGKCVFESDPVVFPRWVVTGDGPTHSFSTRWKLDQTVLLLDWQASAWAPPRRSVLTPPTNLRKSAAGTARIDLDTAEVQLLPSSPRSASENSSGFLPLQRRALRWEGTLGKKFLAVVAEEASPALNGGPTPPPARRQQKLVLLAWDLKTSKPAPPGTLLVGLRPTVLPTLDGRFLCLRDDAPSPDEMMPSLVKRGSDWSIYSLEQGKVVAQARHVPGTQAVSFVDGRAFYLVTGSLRGPLDRPVLRSQSLVAVDTRTGKTLWQHAVAGKLVQPPR
jgi:hypothetical protein